MDHKTLHQSIYEAGLTFDSQAIIKLFSHLCNLGIVNHPGQIKLTSSSGSSVVILLKDETHNKVYQYYRNADVFTDIRNLTEISSQQSQHSLNLSFMNNRPRTELKLTVKYDFNKYRVLPLEFWPEIQTIVWEKILPITQLKSEFLYQHLDQLIWDIMKSLNGFHSIGIIHKDCRLDNIGIKNGKFVLFDYNLSHRVRSTDQYTEDYQMFNRSCQWFLDEHFANKSDINDPDKNSYEKIPASFQNYKYFFMILKNQLKLPIDQIVSQLELMEIVQ